jgi:hypothetical protein
VPPNIARKLTDAVRRQKGLTVEGKVLQHATKQEDFGSQSVEVVDFVISLVHMIYRH